MQRSSSLELIERLRLKQAELLRNTQAQSGNLTEIEHRVLERRRKSVAKAKSVSPRKVLRRKRTD